MESVVQRCSEKAFNFIENEILAQLFSCEFWEISKNTFFYKTPPVTASVTYNDTALTTTTLEYYLVPGAFSEV